MKKYISKYKIPILISIILVCIISIIIFININNKNLVIENEIKKEENLIKENVTEEEKEIIKIDIKGEVKNPGVYQMKKGDRVIDAINASGGLTKNSDTSLINLSKNVYDEMVIKIYTKDDVKNMSKTETIVEYIETECNCDENINNACIESESKEETKISINSATSEQLDSLPGIGLSKANDIINYRNSNGSFKTIEDIKNVSGIGDSLFEKIKDLITI